MKPMSRTEFDEQAEIAYKAVFANEDPYGEPFQTEINHRLLLYGFRYGLHEPWLEPITRSIKLLGEDGFYLTLLKRTGEEPWHWYVPLSEAGQYVADVFPIENAIYSVNGKWGIICSEEDHAVVGGPQIMIEAISEAVSDLDNRTKQFLEAWKHYHGTNNIDIHWLPALLAHIYGLERANTLLAGVELEWLIAGSK